MVGLLYKIMVGAQFLIVPLLFYSCNHGDAPDSVKFADSTATMLSYDHVMIHSGNGMKRYKMTAEIIRRYEYASQPYTEYPKGVSIECYSDTSSSYVIASITANYAILWERTNMWEARGNIVGNNYLENKHFETDVLFWDQENALIYNDHFTKVFDAGNWWYGYGFQTDDTFNKWRFNHSRGQMTVKQPKRDTMQSDTTHTDAALVDSTNEQVLVEDTFTPIN